MKNSGIRHSLLRKMTFAILTTFLTCRIVYAQQPLQKVWIDADTGNETDDVYAIVRILNDKSINVIGLSSAHFNNSDLISFPKWNQYRTSGINTVHISQALNKKILKLSGKSRVNHPLGADRQMGRAWGGSTPRTSSASMEIVTTVRKLGNGEKLHVICMGALTNIASAIALDTTIAPKLICYLLGARYDTKRNYWDKNEFNIRNDLNAFDYLLNNLNTNLIIMPINVAYPFRFKRDSLYTLVKGQKGILKFLKQRWQQTNPDDKERTLWDLALAEAYLKRDLASLEYVKGPPENADRIIQVYEYINTAKMKEDFMQLIDSLKIKADSTIK